MQGKKTFNAYCDWVHTFDSLSDEEAGRLIKHLLKYVNDLDPVAPDRLTEIAFTPLKTTLKRDLEKWVDKCKKNRENVKKRWHTNVYERIRPDTDHTDRDKDRDKDRDIYIPSINEFLSYAVDKKKDVSPEDVRLKYQSWKENGWKDGNGKEIKNWKSKLLNTLTYLKTQKTRTW